MGSYKSDPKKTKNTCDLTGERFGKLSVISDCGIQGKNHLWLCRCDCGNETVATQDHLIHGQKRSCGCLHDTIYQENFKLVAGTSVTKIENRRDKLNSNNTSGCTGVFQQSCRGQKTDRWIAQISFRGKRYYLGCYDNLEDAVEARKKAEKQLYDDFLNWYYQKYDSGQKCRDNR